MPSRSDLTTQLLDARFDDLESMCEKVKHWNLDFTPLSALECAGEVGRVVQSVVGSLELGHARFRVPLHQWAAPPSKRLTFIVLETGLRRLWWRGFDEDANTLLIASPGNAFESYSGADFHCHTISIAEEALVEAAARQELDPPRPSASPEIVRLTQAAAESLRRPLRRLRDGIGDDIDANSVLNVLTSLWCGSERRMRARPSARMRDAAMRRCLAALSDTVLSLPDAADLRVIAGVSNRTLEYAFRERFGIGPAAFLKLHRLGRLRAELLRAGPAGAQVGDLAAHHGFWHAGHLSSDYRRIFGETPRQTLMRV